MTTSALLLLTALVLVLLGAGILTAALRARRRSRLALEGRIKLVAGAMAASPETADEFGGLLIEGTRKFDARVQRVFTIGIRHNWAMRTGTLTLLLTAGVAGSAAWLLTSRVFHFSPLISIAAFLSAAFFAPRFLLSGQQKRAERKFSDRFPDAVDTVARMVRAGLPITAAVRTVAVESSPPVSTVFGAIGDQVKIGVPIEDILDQSSAKIGLPDYRFFTVAVGLQYSTGGNLTQTLEILSDIIRKRRATRMKAKASTGEIRITAYTLALIPVVTTGALLVIQPGYLVPLWTDPRGHYIMMIVGVLLLMAYFSVRAMMRSVTDG